MVIRKFIVASQLTSYHVSFNNFWLNIATIYLVLFAFVRKCNASHIILNVYLFIAVKFGIIDVGLGFELTGRGHRLILVLLKSVYTIWFQ